MRYFGIGRYRPTHSGARRSIWQTLAFSVATLRLINKSFDVLDVDSVPLTAAVPAFLVTKVRRKGLVISCHEVWTRGQFSSYFSKRLGGVGSGMQGFVLRLPITKVCDSKGTSRRLADLGVRTEFIETIELAVDTDRIRRAAPCAWAPDVLVVGHLVTDKRPDLALVTLRILHDRGTKYTLMIVGKGPQRESLERLAQYLRLSDHVVFQEPWADKDTYYSVLKSARVMFAPSRREGFGLAVLEALVVGTPVVMSSEADNLARELVKSSERASIVPPDPEAFANAIQGWLDTPEFVLSLRRVRAAIGQRSA